MRSEEEKLAALQHQLSALVHRENALTAAELKSEMELLKLPAIHGFDLQALSSYQVRVRGERATLQAGRVQCEKQIAEQRKQLLKARKEFRVLEKLKEKRFKGWIYLNDREIEDNAAEAYISRWTQSEGGPA
jgi:hypothetical protein